MERKAAKILAASLLLSAASCGGEGRLAIRSTPSALAAGPRAVPFQIAEARGQMALGNVALALEGFRKASREDPASVDALLGIATCYDRMGRFDQSRRNYEAALAIAPGEPRLYAALADSLAMQGLSAEAQAVRAEFAERLASARASEAQSAAPVAVAALAPEPQPQPQIVASPPVAQPQMAAMAPVVQPQLVAATPAPLPRTMALANAPQPGPRATVPAVPAPALRPLAPEPTAEARPQVLKLFPAPLPAMAAPAPRAQVMLPAPRPSAAEAPRQVAAVAPAVARALPVRMALPAPQPEAALARGPRLERLSLGEVALVTSAVPLWRPQLVEYSQRSATIRYSPLRQASRTAPLLLLNAARSAGLAARTRSYLAQRGWSGIKLGNSRYTTRTSTIFYPASRRASAVRLARQFGFALRRRASANGALMIVLGRDAAADRALRAKRG